MKNAIDMQGRVREIALRNKFSRVGDSKGLPLYENNGIRMRIEADPAGGEVRCEIAAPWRSEILPFLCPAGNGHIRVQVSGGQLFLQGVTTDFDEFEKLVCQVSNAAALYSEDQEAGKLLIPVTLPAVESGSIPAGVLELCAALLRKTRVIVASADLLSLLHCLGALEVKQVVEVDPLKLLGNWTGVLAEADTLSARNGLVILFNLGLLDENNRNATLQYFERQALLPSYCGARWVLHHNGQPHRPTILPVIALPKPAASLHSLLRESGLADCDSHVATLRCLLQGREDTEAALALLKGGCKDGPGDGGPDSGRARWARGPRPGRPKQSYDHLLTIARDLKKENIVGHDSLMEELFDTLISWYLVDSAPLILCFAGPSGTGKNLACAVLADILSRYFETSRPSYLHFNCGAMVDRHGLWQLTGVQAGLKGMENPGLLETLTLGSVLSLDEIDKLHGNGDVQDFLIQLMEDGTFRNGFGVQKSLPKMVMVMTMNAGRAVRDEKLERIGFLQDEGTARVGEHYRDACKRLLLPALRGRIRRTFHFPHLTKTDLIALCRKELDVMFDSLAGLGIRRDDSCDLAAGLIDKLDLSLGARAVLARVDQLRGQLLRQNHNPREN